MPYLGISLNPTFGFKIHKALHSSLECLKDRVGLGVCFFLVEILAFKVSLENIILVSLFKDETVKSFSSLFFFLLL